VDVRLLEDYRRNLKRCLFKITSYAILIVHYLCLGTSLNVGLDMPSPRLAPSDRELIKFISLVTISLRSFAVSELSNSLVRLKTGMTTFVRWVELVHSRHMLFQRLF
jgi:hypothetical protein